MKACERCNKEIPEEYGNLLCDEHYTALVQEREEHQTKVASQQQAEVLKNVESPVHPNNTGTVEPFGDGIQGGEALAGAAASVPSSQAQQPQCDHSTCGISDPAYIENPEADDKNQVLANLAQFIYTHRDADHPKGKKHGILLYYPQRNMYNFVKNYCMKKATSHPQYPKYIWKPKIVDVGCGSGVGSNILSQEADFVWGIDKNEWSVEFAKEAFTREKNGIYYSSQLTFDVIDIMNDNRQFMTFDIVTAIEVAEHIWDIHGFLNQLKRFTKRDKRGNVIDDPQQATEFFVSTPNRAHAKLRKDRPENPFHCREWTALEFATLLRKHFRNVEILNQKGEPVPEDNAIDQIVFAKFSVPL